MEFYNIEGSNGSHRYDQYGQRDYDLRGYIKRDGECQQRNHLCDF